MHDPTWTYWKISCEGNLSTHHYKTSWEKIERLQIISSSQSHEKKITFSCASCIISKPPDFYISTDHHDLKIKLFQKAKKCPNIQFWQNFNSRNIWIFAPKLENILKYFTKKAQKLNFHAKNPDLQVEFLDKNWGLEQCALKSHSKILKFVNFWSRRLNQFWLYFE